MGLPALKENDFIQPYGSLEPDQFVEVTDCLEDSVQKWLWLASKKTEAITHDESRRAAMEDYVYWKAYFALWQYWNTQPVEVSLDEKTTRWTNAQIQAIRTLWERHQENFMAALAALSSGAYADDFRSRVVSSSPSWDPLISAGAGTEAAIRSLT